MFTKVKMTYVLVPDEFRDSSRFTSTFREASGPAGQASPVDRGPVMPACQPCAANVPLALSQPVRLQSMALTVVWRRRLKL